MFYELSNYVNIFWLSIIIKFQFSLKKASKNILISCISSNDMVAWVILMLMIVSMITLSSFTVDTLHNN